jgi:hypothetical protein
MQSGDQRRLAPGRSPYDYAESEITFVFGYVPDSNS